MDQGFFWGTATSSYQVEGAHNSDGKGLSIWDTFCEKKKLFIKDRSSGNISCDHYNRYHEDIEIMAAMNTNAYRFSISWPRILPEGKGAINQKGLDFYQRLIETLLEKGITPFPTLFHFDLPAELERIGGWYNRDVSDYFAEYTNILMNKFSDRVKNWVTINEPFTVISLGYYLGIHPPCHINVFKGREAYHHLMLAHGKAMQVIKGYGDDVRGGISNILYHIEPQRECDLNAVENANKINRLYMDPILKGEYPDINNIFVPGNKVVKSGDMKVISHPTDFVGLNIYTRALVKRSLIPLGFWPVKASYPDVKFSKMGWEVYPKAMYNALKWVSDNYNNPEIYITENGAAFEDKIIGDRIIDTERINYLEKYIHYMEKAKDEGVKVKGYFVWSLLDNFEWGFGYTKKYGLVYVDPKTGNRTPKASAFWYGDLCKQKRAEELSKIFVR